MGLDIRLQHEDILSPCIGFNYVSGRTARGAAAFCAVSAKKKRVCFMQDTQFLITERKDV